MSTFRSRASVARERWTVELASSLSKSRLLAQLGGIDGVSGIVYINIRLVVEIAQKHKHNAQRRIYKIGRVRN